MPEEVGTGLVEEVALPIWLRARLGYAGADLLPTDGARLDISGYDLIDGDEVVLAPYPEIPRLLTLSYGGQVIDAFDPYRFKAAGDVATYLGIRTNFEARWLARQHDEATPVDRGVGYE